jgi:protein phosphatase
MINQDINARDDDHTESDSTMESFSSQLMNRLGFGNRVGKVDYGTIEKQHNLTNYNVFARSEHGPRNQRNEDAYLVLPDIGVFAVSDGMGGHNGGRVASRLTISTLYEGLRSDGALVTEESILSLIDIANQRIYEHSRSNLKLQGMGCTLVLACINNEHLTLFNIGDSRAYRFKNYNLEQLTIDHSRYANDLGQAMAAPVIQRGLTRALGVKPMVSTDITKSDWCSNDMLMLSTDGITDILRQYQLTNILVDNSNLVEMVNKMISAAINSGSDDDKTVLLVKNS